MRYTDEINVIDSSELSYMTTESLCIGENEWFPLSSIHCAFIRYPYDLIPPHTESFKKREMTEFLKTLALMLDNVAPNKIATSWSIRNRLYSMSLASSFGVPVPPRSEILLANRNSLFEHRSHTMFKSLGNCFFSWSPSEVPTSCRDYIKIEEDDGECAVVMPAQKFSAKVYKIINEFGLLFTQSLIDSIYELRLYIIDRKYFCYERKLISGIDQSAAEYLETGIELPQDVLNSLQTFQNHIGFAYCCYDIILDKHCLPTIIDINPFGSLPPYDKFQNATDSLADYIVAYGNQNAQQSHSPDIE